jgi:hypothetical protein
MSIRSTNKLVYSDAGTLSGKWAYVLDQRKTYTLARDVGQFDVVTKSGEVIALVRGCELCIAAGYAWDGLTCWPDTPANMIGGLPHDLGYQLGGCPDSPFTRKEVDGWIRDLIAPRDPWDARIIYAGVRMAGWKFYGKDKSLRIEWL